MSQEMRRALNQLYEQAQQSMSDYGSSDVDVLKGSLGDLIAKCHLVLHYDEDAPN